MELLFKTYLSVKVDLNGERVISSLKVWRPKYEAPILAKTKKNKDTERIDSVFVLFRVSGKGDLFKVSTMDSLPGTSIIVIPLSMISSAVLIGFS